jgi:hypothetical protein
MVAFMAVVALGMELHAATPKLQSVSLSTGLYLDRWAGDGDGNAFGWKLRDDAINRPQTNFSGALGAGISLTPTTLLQGSMGFFHSRLEELQASGNGEDLKEKSKTGLGDFEISVQQKIELMESWTVGSKLVIPGPYEAEYEDPWAGMKVWRLGLNIGKGFNQYYAWGSGEAVIASSDQGMGEVGDFLLKGGVNAKYSLSPLLTLKPGLDLNYSSIRWVTGTDPLNLFSVDPKITLILARHWKRSLALTVGGTLYSHQSGERFLNIYAPRKIFLGLGASVYL